MSGTWFGLLLGSQRKAAASLYAAVRTEASAALEAGMRVLVAPEHLHAEPYAMLRPWPLLAALRADLGEFAAVGSVIAGLTSVTQLAGDLATVGSIGAGPVGVALAAGYRADDFAAAGRSHEDRFRLRAAMRRDLVAREVLPAHLLWSAAGTVTAARQATVDGAVWYGAPSVAIETHRRITDAAGRGVLRCDVLLGATGADVRRGWERYVAPKYGALSDWGYSGGSGAVLAGTAEQVADRLAAVLAEVDPAGIVVRLCWPDMDGPTAAEHVRDFGARVLPRLASVTGVLEPPSTGRDRWTSRI